jgi:hypothetical protein
MRFESLLEARERRVERGVNTHRAMAARTIAVAADFTVRPCLDILLLLFTLRFGGRVTWHTASIEGGAWTWSEPATATRT